MNLPILHTLDELRAWLAEHERRSRLPGATRYVWQRAEWSVDRWRRPRTATGRWSWRATGSLLACEPEREPEQLALCWLGHGQVFAADAGFEETRRALGQTRMTLQLCARIERQAGWQHSVAGHMRSGAA